MRQTTNYPGGSPLLAGMISELVVGAITGVSSVRRFYFRTILFVAIAAFAGGMLIRDYLPNKAATAGQIAAPAQEPAKPRQAQPPPRERDDPEELQKLIRKDPL